MTNFSVLIMVLVLTILGVGLKTQIEGDKLIEFKRVKGWSDFFKRYYFDVVKDLGFTFIVIGCGVWIINFILCEVYWLIKAGWL